MSSHHCKLTIDLDAVADNWRAIRALSAPAICAAVVKADAYGLGVQRVGPCLHRAGCRHFFVASFDEARQLRQLLPSTDVQIYTLAGVFPGDELACVELSIRPVLVSLEMLRRWASVASGTSLPAPSALKLNTGMNRMGLSAADTDTVLEESALLQRAQVHLVMSHMACADEVHSELNEYQRQIFAGRIRPLQAAKTGLVFSLANSAATLRGAQYHFDLVRPGIALYGVDPLKSSSVQLRPVVRLALPIIQAHPTSPGQWVGYGASYGVDRPGWLLTVAGGYADGLLRSLSNRAHAYFGEHKVTLAGRVSMDTCTFFYDGDQDCSSLVAGEAQINLLGARQGLAELAEQADTIPYELLTSLGERFGRHYIEAGVHQYVDA